jgi:double zinc ribbon protein
MSEVNSPSFSALAFPCGHNNPDDYLFCDVCGVRRPSRCSSCQAINRGTANFCGKCGSKMTGLSKLDSDLVASTQGPVAEARGVPRQNSSLESGTATSAPVGGHGRASGAPAAPPPRNEPQLREDAVVLGRSGDAVPTSENVERNAPAPLRRRSKVQYELREPILEDDDESLQDAFFQRLVSGRNGAPRRLARAWWWGILAAVTLAILLVVAVRFAASGASQPLAVAESPSVAEKAPAPHLGQPLPTHVEPMPLNGEADSTLRGESGRGTTAPCRSGEDGEFIP